MSNRISLLVQACQVVGVYGAGATAVQRMLQQGGETLSSLLSSWAIFAEKGGVEGSVELAARLG